jgi:hypothetical protein
MGRTARWWLKPTRRWINYWAIGAGVLLVVSAKMNRQHSEVGEWLNLQLRRWTGIEIYYERLFVLAVLAWALLLVTWAVFASGRAIVVNGCRQYPSKLTLDRGRRRFASCIFLLSAAIAGWRSFACPHATYHSFWGWGGIAWSDRGGPCKNQSGQSTHLAGNWYLFTQEG